LSASRLAADVLQFRSTIRIGITGWRERAKPLAHLAPG
jgi:hypothetical protein